LATASWYSGACPGVFHEIWRQGLLEYDDVVGIDWEWLAADGAMGKAPLGGPKTGPNPTDRSARSAPLVVDVTIDAAVEPLVDQLEQVIRDHALAEMPPDPSGEVAAMSFSDLLITFGVWRDRLVPRRPRRVHRSTDLNASTAAREHHTALTALVNKIKSGGDLTPHLSHRVETAHVPDVEAGDKLHLRPDRDLMLADWGIHHLHLYVPHGDELLFVKFRPNDAYLIGIYKHGDWAERSVLKVMVRMWPDADLAPMTMSGVSLTQHFTDEEFRQMRNAGIAQGVEIDGQVTFGFQTTAGTPLDVSRRVMKLRAHLNSLRDHEDEWKADNARIVNERMGREITDPWEPAVHEELCGLARGGCFVALAPLP
jgi:hypothetical protein